jgi:hypothetical protein
VVKEDGQRVLLGHDHFSIVAEFLDPKRVLSQRAAQQLELA